MKALMSLAVVLSVLQAAAQRSPFNGLEVLPADSNGHYRILIGGHFHGTSSNRSGYPAATLLANLDTINKLGANLFLSTGDLFMDAEKDRERYEQAFFSKLKVPLFNASGNHDVISSMSTGEEYPQLIEISVGNPGHVRIDRILILDLEKDDGEVSEKALEVLDRYNPGTIATHYQVSNRFFIISHRPIWSEGDPLYSDLFKDNTRSLTGTNFHGKVYPILENITEHAHVYWISGSLGGGAPSSIFYQQHAPNITYIQCAIRDEPRDALLIADVYPDTVKWSALSLTGRELMAPEAYDAAWWREHVGKEEGFNWRLLPYMIKTTVLRREFWWGALTALVLAWLVRRLVRRWF